MSGTGTVLVLGATGTLGPQVVSAFRAKGVTPRVFTRDAARADGRWGSDVEVAEGDFDDESTVRHALAGVEAMLLLTPHARDMAEVQLRIVRLTRRSAIRVVKISGTASAITPAGPEAGRQHWEVERVLDGSGQPFVILRPNAFMQSLLGGMVAAAVRATGTVPNAIGDAGISFVDCADVGRVAAEALTGDGHLGKTYVLTGPAPITLRDVAVRIGAARGRDVPVVEVTPAEVRRTLLTRGFDEWEAGHFEEMYQLFRDHRSEFVSDDVLHVTGARPRSVGEFLEGHAALFDPSEGTQ